MTLIRHALYIPRFKSERKTDESLHSQPQDGDEVTQCNIVDVLLRSP